MKALADLDITRVFIFLFCVLNVTKCTPQRVTQTLNQFNNIKVKLIPYELYSNLQDQP